MHYGSSNRTATPWICISPRTRPDIRAIERYQVGPGHGDYGAFWPVPGVPLGVHELKTIEVHGWLRAIADDTRPDGDFEDGWRVCQVLDAVEQSAAERRWVDLPPD